LARSLHALIAGAGIAGLTSALALARAGHRVTVIERSKRLVEAGAGLQLSPNATAALTSLGLLERILRFALAPDSLHIWRSRDGAELMRLPLGPLAELRWRSPTLVIHRADLQKALLQLAKDTGAIEIVTGAEALGFAASLDSIQVGARRGGDNVRFDGDLLIGADGLHSAVRERLGLGASDVPLYSGRTAWRALLPASEAPAPALRFATNLWLGPHAHLVHYPLRDGELVNVVAIVEDSWRGARDGDFWSQIGDPAEIKARFSRWHSGARDLIGRVRDWRRWPLFDRHAVNRWSDRRVVLIGDAAHPVLPFLAQGACLAIEDAAALASAITRNGDDIAAAIREYEARRMTRAAEIRLASRRQGAIYHMSGPLAFARDLTMKTMPQRALQRRLDWIYKYRTG